MKELTFISYNITESDYLFKIILDFLTLQSNTILFLQEVKSNFKIDQKNHNVIEPPGQNIMSDLRIFASKDLNQMSLVCDSYDRYQILKTSEGNFVNVHMPSSWRTDDDVLINYSRIAREICENIQFELVGGDMNANPFEKVVFMPSAWFAKRSVNDFTQERDKGLINPFWKISYIGMDDEAKGSYPGDNKKFSRLQILDQFFVSPQKRKNVLVCGIMEELFGENFNDINKKDDVTSTKGRGKLHFPVFIKYKLGD